MADRRPRPGEDGFVDERAVTGKRGYSWEPFEKGHTFSLKDGVHSRRFLASGAERLRAEIVKLAPWVARPAFAATLEAWSFAEAACRVYRARFDVEGLVDESGETTSGFEQWQRVESRAQSLRAELGLSPGSLAKLMASTAVAAGAAGLDDQLAELRREGARILAARERGELTAGDGRESGS